MKRTWTLLGIGLALALPLTACTRDKAPDVTPTPSPVVTSQPSTMPENTPAALIYKATWPEEEAGDAAKDVTRGVGDAARDIVDGVGDAAKDIGNGVKRATK